MSLRAEEAIAIRQFLDTCCVPEGRIARNALYTAYLAWRGKAWLVKSRQWFGSVLHRHCKVTNEEKNYVGISLRTSGPPAVD